MKILFAPSEGKREGGSGEPINAESFLFPELYEKRLEVIHRYDDALLHGDDEALAKLFGVKDTKEFIRYKTPLESAPTMKAIERYDGVAYGYLGYTELSEDAQEYIERNVIVFSNLFGPMGAGDFIPDYKLKQGNAIGSLKPETFYHRHFSDALDRLLEGREVLDLRAGFYDKFYVPKSPITTLKFLKEGKVVSHWAKAYRGIVLRTLCMNAIESLEGLLTLPIEGLSIHEMKESKKKREIIYQIHS